MIISDQVPYNQTPEGKIAQDQQAMKSGMQGAQGASYLKNKLAMSTLPNNQMMAPNLSGAGGPSSQCPTCGSAVGPNGMQSGTPDEEPQQ